MNSFKKKVLASAIVISAGIGISFNAFASGTAAVPVSATITGTCKVTTAPTALNFGAIDPSGTANVTTTTTFAMKCTNGTASTGTDDGGQHASAGVKRMIHSVTTTAFLPYAIAYPAATGTGTGFGAAATTVTVTGTITPAQFQNALVTGTGQNYSDTVTITVNP
jgi:spore coat protein U-like protein